MSKDGSYEPQKRRRVWRKRTADNREGVAAPAAEVMSHVVARLGGSDRIRLVGLWRSWAEVLGPEFAALARLIAHHSGAQFLSLSAVSYNFV